MRITTPCRQCKQPLKKRTLATDRVELARTEGESIALRCGHCSSLDNYAVDEFRAAPGLIAHLAASVVFVAGTPFLLHYVTGYLQDPPANPYALLGIMVPIGLPVVIYTMILQNDRKRVNAFNRHKLKGRR